jgi:integrase/recombinase XerD
MSDYSSFVDGFMLKFDNSFSTEQLRFIRDALNVYTLNYDIKPVTTELSLTQYQLPQAYFIFMASKEQDGKLSAMSKQQYKMCLEDMLYFLAMPLKDITTNHLRLYLQKISKSAKTGKPISDSTMNQRKSIIRSFFTWLYEEEYIEKNPAVRIKTARDHSKPRTEYSDTDIEKIRESCKTKRDRAIIDLLTSSGIRISECVGMNRNDVDFINREILVYGKGGKWRKAYIDGRTIVSLRSYLEERTDTNEALFVSMRSPYDRLTSGGVRKLLHGLQDESHVNNIIPHRFRHTMATSMVNRGMPIETIGKILGHSLTSTTLRYAHLSEAKIKNDYMAFH